MMQWNIDRLLLLRRKKYRGVSLGHRDLVLNQAHKEGEEEDRRSKRRVKRRRKTKNRSTENIDRDQDQDLIYLILTLQNNDLAIEKTDLVLQVLFHPNQFQKLLILKN